MVRLPAARNATSSSPRLDEDQVRFFDAHGYLVLRNWIPAPLLDRLREASEVWTDRAARLAPGGPDAGDFQFGRPGGRRSLFKVQHLHNKGHLASLELLGSPAVLGVAESLCGPDFVPTYDAVVMKQQDGGANVPWHQDAVHPRTDRIVNFGVYLDPSREGEGALRVLPGTQVAAQDICARASDYGWDAPGAVTVEVGPGDVLLHDVMVVHGSPQVLHNRLRRTVYIEFRAAHQILAEGPWDLATIRSQLTLVRRGLEQHRRQFPDLEQFGWGVSEEFRPPEDDQAGEREWTRTIVTPGTYCSAGNATRA